MARLYAAARLHVNFFQPSFKLAEKRREGAKVIKRYHPPATPYARALAHPKLSQAIKRRLRETYRGLDPVALLSEIRGCQTELGDRIGRRGIAVAPAAPTLIAPKVFAKSLGATKTEVRATHRQAKRKYKTRIRMPSKLDPHLAAIEGWFAAEPAITALAILGRLGVIDPATFDQKQHSIVQRLLKKLRAKATRFSQDPDLQPHGRVAGRSGDAPPVGLRPPSGSSPPIMPRAHCFSPHDYADPQSNNSSLGNTRGPFSTPIHTHRPPDAGAAPHGRARKQCPAIRRRSWRGVPVQQLRGRCSTAAAVITDPSGPQTRTSGWAPICRNGWASI